MQKVLTSQNFRFLNPPTTQTPLEEIEIHPNTLHEGELGTGTQNTRITQGTEGSTQEDAA